MTGTRPVSIPVLTRAAMFARLLAVQASWNYETLLGNGIGFCMEPALRRLPGGRNGPAYRAALARESRYFNAHPYLAAVAVGALARAELDGEDPDRVERFRTALCGPLGSVGDRLVWASFLPACSFAALLVFGLGGGPLAVLVVFLGGYNAGHVALRLWGLEIGVRRGLAVASALGTPALRRAPQYIGRVAAVLAGFALPLVMTRVVAPGGGLRLATAAAAVLGGALLARLHGRIEGWKVSVLLLLAFVVFGVTR
jgi:PTS system mannose-specific IID component